ncbi:MAG: glycosyltransferase family 4 protein [Lachnospira sp.]|nr:glycosyltransferase family 4 protein [Lachnospira sp.]
MKKIGFVIPWYYENIKGGAEQELRGLVKHLHDAGIDVEIITTCVKEFASDWTENYFKEGVEQIDGVVVRRFKVRKGDMKEFHKVNARLMQGNTISYEEETTFLREMVNSPDMYDYLREHSEDYHRYVFIPYMFGTTYYGIQACPFKSILIPCFHDESYAYFRHFRETFRDLRGIVFNAKPEQELANEILDLRTVKQLLLGIGIETDIDYDADRFRKKYNINSPYIIYAGRKDEAKNINTLIKYFDEYRKRNKDSRQDIKLVLIGGGEVNIPDSIKDDVYDLGFVDIQDKYDACAGALCLCQPSKNESFSIVIMESWLCKRPVLVHNQCNVTSNFVKESNAGLYFDNYFEFEGCINYYIDNPQVAAKMGEAGRQYVLDNFKWDVIMKKFLEFLNI